MVISWNTHKVDQGFEFHVYSFAHQEAAKTLKRGVCATRAQAKSHAQRWCRWFKRSSVKG